MIFFFLSRLKDRKVMLIETGKNAFSVFLKIVIYLNFVTKCSPSCTKDRIVGGSFCNSPVIIVPPLTSSLSFCSFPVILI